MEIRTLTQKENLAYDLLSCVCFGEEAGKDYENYHKNLDEHTSDWENRIGAFDKNGELIAALYVIPYNMYFDGQAVKMGGIQGVVTAPESRGTGVMNKVFHETLRFMKDKGQVFSILYPFSYAYYRKFGYEITYQLNKAVVPTLTFGHYPYPKDSVRFWKKSDGFADLMSIYDAFAKSRNMSIYRDEKSWKDIMKDDPYIKRKHTYIHYDAQNKPDAYVRTRVHFPANGQDRQVSIDELAWTTQDGLFAMFGFIGGLRPQYGEAIWEVPMSLDLYTLFPEAWDVSIETPSSVQTRIVDLSAALKLMRVPTLFNGNVCIDVFDKSFPDNNGKYCISWESGTVSVEKTDRAPDMSTSIEAMSQLVLGYLTPDMAAYRADTTIHSQHEALMALFPKKDLYLGEKF